MEDKCEEDKLLLPHHEQQELCTTRLPYRQGRQLTAVKVYTVNNESRHLLIFGVPSLNLRQEAKAQFLKFGKLLQFNLSNNHKNELFTETYHALYERIQSARIAKRMLDAKTFYGGSLHICYAPELETIEETRGKLQQRKKDVYWRLKNLERETSEMASEKLKSVNESVPLQTNLNPSIEKLNMGQINTIGVGKQIRDVVKYNLKRKSMNTDRVIIEKQFKPCFIEKPIINIKDNQPNKESNEPVEIIDCTSTEKETITNVNINETLNYNSFGKELIRKIPEKPVNCIRFNLKNKKDLG